MVRRSVPDDSYGRGAFTRSVELREVQTLPCPERDLPIAYREGHAVADQDCLDVSGAVSFGMRVLRVAGHGPLECGEQIFLHVGVRVLVHEDGRGRMRDRDGDDPVSNLRARHRGLHTRCDIDGLLALGRLDRDLLVSNGHARVSAASRCAAIRAISAAVALPPLTTSTVRRPRGSILPARTAASGADPEGSTRRERDSRYSYEARSSSPSPTVTKSST